MDIDSSTKLYCLIGHPVSKSLSPKIHNHLFKENNINARYLAFDVEEEDLEKAVLGLKSIGAEGFNVTIPHKINIMKYLDEIDEEAKLLGAVNTVKRINDKFVGYNTDGSGFIKMLDDNSIDFKNKHILILGAGGAGRGISLILAKEGVKEIYILNRTLIKAKELAQEINRKFPSTYTRWGSLKDTEVNYRSFDIIINTTSIGMYPDVDNMPLNPVLFRSDAVAIDIVYKPIMTKFLLNCRNQGIKVVDGLNLLTKQAIFSGKIWYNGDVNFRHLQEILKEGKAN